MTPTRRAATRGRNDARHDLVISLLLAGITVAAYGRIWDLGFVSYDDPPYVTENVHVLSGLGWSGIAWAFTATAESNWHPLTWLSLMLDATVWGSDPHGYHATNLALHVANTLLLFALLGRATGSRWRSAFVAALFAVHPLHVESVAWVAERKDVLSTLFWMLTTLAYGRYVASPSPGRYVAVLVSFALGLMTKPMLVTLPVTLLLLDYWPLGRLKESRAEAIARVREKLPLFALTGLSAIATLLVQRPAMQVLAAVPFGARVANALISYVAYIGKMLWPRDLAVIYPYPHAPPPLWQPAAAALFLVTVSVAAILARRERPWFTVGWLFYLVTLVPVCGLVQVGYQSRADRFTYVPLIGLFVVVAWGVPELFERIAGRVGYAGSGRGSKASAAGAKRATRRAAPTVSSLAHSRLLPTCATTTVVILSLLTWRQVGVWRSSIDLFTHAIEATSENPHAQYDLSAVLEEQGDVDRAVVHLREALRIDPLMAEAHFNLTRIMMRQGKIDEATSLVREEQDRWPSHSHTFVDLGVLAVLQGKRDEAVTWFTEALRWPPDAPDARHNLEVLMAEKGRASAEGAADK